MDADSSDVLVVRVISVSSEGTVATLVENADTRCIEMGGVEARYVKFTGIETRGDGSNNNKWVTCGECNAKKEVTEDTTPTVEPAKPTEPTEPTEPTKPAEETLTPVLCTDMTVTGFSSEETVSEHRPASNLGDCEQEPGWTSAWSAGSTPPPHWIIIDLGKERNRVSAGCLGRASANGRIKDVAMETNTDHRRRHVGNACRSDLGERLEDSNRRTGRLGCTLHPYDRCQLL